MILMIFSQDFLVETNITNLRHDGCIITRTLLLLPLTSVSINHPLIGFIAISIHNNKCNIVVPPLGWEQLFSNFNKPKHACRKRTRGVSFFFAATLFQHTLILFPASRFPNEKVLKPTGYHSRLESNWEMNGCPVDSQKSSAEVVENNFRRGSYCRSCCNSGPAWLDLLSCSCYLGPWSSTGLSSVKSFLNFNERGHGADDWLAKIYRISRL